MPRDAIFPRKDRVSDKNDMIDYDLYSIFAMKVNKGTVRISQLKEQ